MNIYLGGVLAKSKQLKAEIIANVQASYFDPSTTMDNYDGLTKRKAEFTKCDYCICLISPIMEGFREIIDVVDESNKSPQKIIYCYINSDNNQEFTEHQIKSLQRIGEMIEKNGATWCRNIAELTTFLKSKA